MMMMVCNYVHYKVMKRKLFSPGSPTHNNDDDGMYTIYAHVITERFVCLFGLML